MHLYIKKNIFVPFNTRCCRSHFDECGLIDGKEIQNIIIVQNRVKLSGDQLTKLFKHIQERDARQTTLFSQFKELETTSERLYIDHTGFSKDEFIFIMNELKSLKNSESRSKEQALAIYLT